MMCNNCKKCRRPRHRSGSVVVLTAFMLVVLFSMVAFSIDTGYITHAKTELQRTADSCALAAAMRIPELDTALAVAQTAATQNLGTVGPAINASDVEFGYWDRDSATFTSPAPATQDVNAVRITVQRTASRGNPLQLFFAHMLGVSKGDVMARAIAMSDRNLCGPFIGIDWLSVPGSVTTDSYNSDDGSYVAASAGDRGSLCSDGPIDLHGATIINGDARAGKDYDVSLYGAPIVTGSKGSRLKPLNMPPVDASQAIHVNNNAQVPPIPKGNSWQSPVDANGNFLLDGSKNLTLPPGTYYFNDLTLTGMAVLNFSGKTTIYLTGNLLREGGVTVNNNTQIPGNVQILMTGGTANITSSNAFHGVIYAPNTDVTLDGDSQYYGAIVGKTLTIAGISRGHYDEALGQSGTNFPRRSALVD